MKTAQSFFIWVGILVSLIISCASLLSLWFGLIDVVTTGYPEGTAMQTAAAGLLIAFPLYVWLTRLVHMAERADPATKDIWVRTWVLYGILFISVATIAVDVFILLSSFLSGEEMTASFLLKSFSAAALLTASFWYYMKEIRQYWVDHKSQSELVGMSVGAAVVFSIVLLFVVAGSPNYLRKIAKDKLIVSDLQSLQYQIIDYWQKNGSLPKVLTELNDPISGYSVPTGGSADIQYTPTGAKEFELCAVFAAEYKVIAPKMESYPIVPSEYWEHAPGKACFKRVIDESKYPVNIPSKGPLPVR
jgi:hypothetical protein